MTLCVERAAICVKEIFSNQLTQKRRALPLGCSGRSLRSSDATEARQSDRARTKTRARPPICGLRRPVGVPNSPVSWRRKTPDTTKSDSRPSEPARLTSSWPTRKAPRASRGPAGHQRRGENHLQSRGGDNRDIRETHLTEQGVGGYHRRETSRGVHSSGSRHGILWRHRIPGVTRKRPALPLPSTLISDFTLWRGTHSHVLTV